MASTPDYVFLRSKLPRERFSTEEMTKLLGFHDDTAMFRTFLSAEPQTSAWTEFNQDYFEAVLERGHNPRRPYVGIGDDGSNFNRANIRITLSRSITAFRGNSPRYSGEVGAVNKDGYKQIDHYIRFIHYVITKNRQPGGIWENEAIDDSPHYDAELKELCNVAYQVLVYLCGMVLYIGQEWHPDYEGNRGEGNDDDDEDNDQANNRQTPRPVGNRRGVGGGRFNGGSGHGRRSGGRNGSGHGSAARGSRGVCNLPSRINHIRRSNTSGQLPTQSRDSTPRSSTSGRSSTAVKIESGVKREGMVVNIVRKPKVKKEHGLKKEPKIKMEPR